MRRLIGSALLVVGLCQNTGRCDDEPAAVPAPVDAAVPAEQAVPADAAVLVEEVVTLQEAAPIGFDFGFFEGIVEAIADELVPAAAAPAPDIVVGRGRAAQIEVQIKQILPHFVQQLQPVLSAELAFIRQFCDVPKEQRPKIKAAGEASLQQAARALAGQQFQNDGNPFGGGKSPSDPRQLIAEALAKALAENLTAGQIAVYSAESAKRTARRKHAAILCAVSQLDDALWFTEEQREQVFKSIDANWQGKWEQWLMLPRYGGMYFPQIPDQFIVSHLNEEQKSVWNGLQKVDFGSWGVSEALAQEEDDGWWGEEPAKPADAAGAGFIGAPVILPGAP